MRYLSTYNDNSEYQADKPNFVKTHVSYVKEGKKVHYDKIVQIDWSKRYLTFEAVSAGTFSCTSACSYSVDDGATWNALAADTQTPTVNAGNKILFKATNVPVDSKGIGTFSSTAEFNAMGNPYSMISGDSFTAVTTLASDSLFSMFSGNTNIISAENLSLPVTTLADYCYSVMFKGCTSLTTAPVLSATTLAKNCYSSMFSGCTSLTTAPVLSSTTLAEGCYKSMFIGCTALTTTPELPASTMAKNCYSSMFSGCTSLTTAPVLSSTTLAENCYQGMFDRCTSLTTAPVLPATTLAKGCYWGMFEGCTSLTSSPDLLAPTLADWCYYLMFAGCTSLNYIKMTATDISATSALASWVNLVPSGGTFVKDASMTSLPTGTSGIPEGWTVVDA